MAKAFLLHRKQAHGKHYSEALAFEAMDEFI